MENALWFIGEWLITSTFLLSAQYLVSGLQWFFVSAPVSLNDGCRCLPEDPIVLM